MVYYKAAALLHAFLSGIAICFQVALSLGAPWGEYAMGGSHPGEFSVPMKIAAVFQAFVIFMMTVIVLSRAGIILSGWYRASGKIIWVVVAYGTIGLVLNLITPSKMERVIWAPVVFFLLVSSLTVALSPNKFQQE